MIPTKKMKKTTFFEPTDDSDVKNEGFLKRILSKIDGH